LTEKLNSYLLFIILLSLFTILGCNTKTNELDQSNNNMIFTGESKHWLATYSIEFNNDNTFKRLLDIKLKESNTIDGLIEYTLYKNGEKQTYGTGEAGSKIGGTGGGSGAKPLKNDKYVLEIKWKDGEETFPLDLK
jgi:hypothetical protein